MSTFPLKASSKIFLEVAKKFDNQTIAGSTNVAAFFAELQDRLGGLVILDFLDMANWDRIEKYSIEPESGILTLTWHDYRDKTESEDEKESRQMFLPASLYQCALHINSIVPIIGKSTAVFLINGYAKTEKEIRKLYSPNADDFKILDNSFFEKRVVRRINGHFEVIDFHCTPIFSLAIVPKQSGLGSHHSKNILYAHNFQQAIGRLNSVVNALDSMINPSPDDIAEKVNTARRIMEFILKVECCSRELRVNKNYSMALLGDLISVLKPTKEEHIQTLLARFVEYANEFSHDSGKPVEIAKAKVVAMLALAYASLIDIEYR